tara:strand:- start:105 stop:1196 length:1092 start_codon:yes stop_codon:yes gene_type:complete
MNQSQIKEKLLRNIRDEKIPNAICFIDKGGRGSLQLASELGLCIVSNQNVPLNKSNYIHPDLHYVYPTKMPKEEKLFKKGMTAYYIEKWREFITTHIYGSVDEWLNFSASNNKLGTIRVGQISEAISILNLKPFQSNKKVCLIWGLDYLKEESANKLLKLIEEPPEQTYFFLIAVDEKKIIPTIASRCQIINLPPLGREEIKENLTKMGYDASLSIDISKVSKGNLNAGVSKIINGEIIKEREGHFIDCLRGCYIAAKKGEFSYIIKKSNELDSLNKYEIKQFFLFGVDFIRQSYFYSQGIELYEFKSLNDFSIENFAPYVTNKNYKKLISLFTINLNYIERNANPKILISSFLLEFSNILYK